MIARIGLLREVEESLETVPVTVLSGPRQCGKTTLARTIHGERKGVFFDLEDPETAEAFANAKSLLGKLDGLVVIDEAQLRPDLYPVLRVLVDADRREGKDRRFLLTGSAAPELMHGTAESLAGRVRHIAMGGFALEEVGAAESDRLWVRGGFPDSFLAPREEVSFRWRKDFIETFLLRDLARFGVGVPSSELRRLWIMVAHLHGQLVNLSELGRSLSVSYSTVRRHLDLLEQAYVVRRLQPWHENLAKRQRKAPKIFVRDSGILHGLLGLVDEVALRTHPKAGASWEGYAIEQILSALRTEEAWFWQTQAGAELDLLVFVGGRRIGFECKLSDRPRRTKSMHVAMEDLGLDHLHVIYPGELEFPLGDDMTALPLSKLPSRVDAGL